MGKTKLQFHEVPEGWRVAAGRRDEPRFAHFAGQEGDGVGQWGGEGGWLFLGFCLVDIVGNLPWGPAPAQGGP